MKLTVSHRITTRFDPTRRRLIQSLRLVPTACASQSTRKWQMTLSGGETGSEFTDGAGDSTRMVSTGGEVAEHTLDISGTVVTADTTGVLRDLKEKVPPLTYMSETRLIRPDSAITALAKEAVAGIAETAPLERAHALANAVHAALEPLEAPANGPLPAAEVLESGTRRAARVHPSGDCRRSCRRHASALCLWLFRQSRGGAGNRAGRRRSHRGLGDERLAGAFVGRDLGAGSWLGRVRPAA